MFDGFMELFQWVLDSSTDVWNTLSSSMGYIGVMIIGLPIVRKIVELVRKIFK